jgi:hypothetical protein
MRRDYSKTRELDREHRRTGGWTSLGFAIVVIAIAAAVLMLILGAA